MLVLQTYLCIVLSNHIIKETFSLGFINTVKLRVLRILLFIYFICVVIFLNKTRFTFLLLPLPLIAILYVLTFLRKQEEKNMLLNLFSLLLPLESRMKLGLSFLTSWKKGVSELQSRKIKQKMHKITKILQFQQTFHYSDKEIENFIHDLIIIHQSPNPLRKLQHLHRKVRIEQVFRTKSKRVMLQIQIQSSLLSLFYLSLLIWTVMSYGSKYIHLMLFSLCLFTIGLFWIFKTGKTMKWSV